MKLYFTDKQVPELSNIADYKRGIVRDGALDLFCKERHWSRWWFRFCNGLLILPGIITYNVSDAAGNQFWTSAMIAAFPVIIIGIVYQSILTERLRPYFQQYIEGHQNEID
ncbi:MAG: hypothetical protein ABSG87_07260 [Verrucomicrobiota bacterium]|jgi:hypothetical protein